MAEGECNEEEWIDLTGDGGILKKILVEGSGLHPAKNVEVIVDYHGTLVENGEMFDSSVERGEPFKFTLGVGKVIKGWDQGIPTMLDGEKCILRCRSDYAYGKEGGGPRIPGGATLDFEVTMLDQFRDVEEFAGMRNRTLFLKEETYINVEQEATVVFDFKVGHSTTDELYSLNDASLVVDDYDTFEGDWPEFFHNAILTQSPNSTVLYECQSSEYPPCPTWNVESDVYYLTVNFKENGVNNPKGLWQMNDVEKAADAKERKEKGNLFFKRQIYDRAIDQYKKGLNGVDKLGDEGETNSEDEDMENTETVLSGNDLEELKELKQTLNSNIAMAYLRVKKFTEAIDAASKVLEENPKHTKCLTRRARGYIERGDFEAGREDLAKILAKDPANKYCQQLDEVAKKKIAAFKKKRKKLAQKMFGGK